MMGLLKMIINRIRNKFDVFKQKWFVWRLSRKIKKYRKKKRDLIIYNCKMNLLIYIYNREYDMNISLIDENIFEE